MTSDNKRTDAPYLTARMSTTNRNGTDRKTSVIRISVVSTSPAMSPEREAPPALDRADLAALRSTGYVERRE